MRRAFFFGGSWDGKVMAEAPDQPAVLIPRPFEDGMVEFDPPFTFPKQTVQTYVRRKAIVPPQPFTFVTSPVGAHGDWSSNVDAPEGPYEFAEMFVLSV